jgi:dihydrofolate reductase
MKAIVAVDKNWGIGYQGNLLVHLPEDLQYFKEKTLGKVLVMGRETLESLPGKRPLPGRTTIVLTRDESYEATCTICNSVEQALEILKVYPEADVFIAGGAQIYKAFLPYCTEIYVTKIDQVFSCDRFFEDLDASKEWALSDESEAHVHSGIHFKFTKYKRIMTEA